MDKGRTGGASRCTSNGRKGTEGAEVEILRSRWGKKIVARDSTVADYWCRNGREKDHWGATAAVECAGSLTTLALGVTLHTVETPLPWTRQRMRRPRV